MVKYCTVAINILGKDKEFIKRISYFDIEIKAL